MGPPVLHLRVYLKTIEGFAPEAGVGALSGLVSCLFASETFLHLQKDITYFSWKVVKLFGCKMKNVMIFCLILKQYNSIYYF